MTADHHGVSLRVRSRTKPIRWPIAGAPIPWLYWGVRHGFIATITDQGALIRAHACYTPPTWRSAALCDGSATRINVLQHSALPAIVDAPRSVLVRTGQTANFSVTVSGLPAPTLHLANTRRQLDRRLDRPDRRGRQLLTTPRRAMALADNGIQYRVLATNAMGSTASTAVTVSVSDLDVAPSITTQPANLSVASGSDAVFAVDARGTEALSYQWCLQWRCTRGRQ